MILDRGLRLERSTIDPQVQIEGRTAMILDRGLRRSRHGRAGPVGTTRQNSDDPRQGTKTELFAYFRTSLHRRQNSDDPRQGTKTPRRH